PSPAADASDSSARIQSRLGSWAVITLATPAVDIKIVTLLREIMGELKILGVVGFIVGSVWVCAWASQMDDQANRIRYWPAIAGRGQIEGHPITATDPGSELPD